MTKQDIASVALKLMGVWLLMWCGMVVMAPLMHVAITLCRSGRFEWNELVTTMVVAPIAGATILVAGGFILCSDRLAKRLFPAGEPSTETVQAPSASDCQAIGLSVLGAYLAIAGLAGVARILGSTLTYLWIDSLSNLPAYAQFLAPQGFAMALQAALGSYLFVQSRRVAALWRRLQRPQEDDA